MEDEQYLERERARQAGQLMIISEAIGLLIARHPESKDILARFGGYTASGTSATVVGEDLDVPAEVARIRNIESATTQGMKEAESAIRDAARR